LGEHLDQFIEWGGLPPKYVAAPHVKMGTEIEIDVGTFEVPDKTMGLETWSEPLALAKPLPTIPYLCGLVLTP
jgi:hypothetical protein